MKVQFDIKGPSKEKMHHFYGLMTSLFDILDDVLLKKTRSSKINHLFEERLQKSEVRELHVLFNSIIKELSLKGQKIKIGGATDQSMDPIPDIFLKRFKNFGFGVSTSASGLHQVPIGGDDSRNLEIETIVKRSILDAIKSNI